MPTTPDEPRLPATGEPAPPTQGGPLWLPGEWVDMPEERPVAGVAQPGPAPHAAPQDPTSWDPAPVSPRGPTPWATPAASGSQNSRAVIGAVLGGLAAVGVIAAWSGMGFVPLLGVVGLGIAGIVLSSTALVSARRGLATNRGLAVTGLVLSIVGVLGVVALYAYVIMLVAAVVSTS